MWKNIQLKGKKCKEIQEMDNIPCGDDWRKTVLWKKMAQTPTKSIQRGLPDNIDGEVKQLICPKGYVSL